MSNPLAPYVLFLLHNDPNSLQALSIYQGSKVSICYADELDRSERPVWLEGVPTIWDVIHSKMMTGTDALRWLVWLAEQPDIPKEIPNKTIENNNSLFQTRSPKPSEIDRNRNPLPLQGNNKPSEKSNVDFVLPPMPKREPIKTISKDEKVEEFVLPPMPKREEPILSPRSTTFEKHDIATIPSIIKQEEVPIQVNSLQLPTFHEQTPIQPVEVKRLQQSPASNEQILMQPLQVNSLQLPASNEQIIPTEDIGICTLNTKELDCQVLPLSLNITEREEAAIIVPSEISIFVKDEPKPQVQTQKTISLVPGARKTRQRKV